MSENSERFVCYECIGDPFLRNEILGEGKVSYCSYCGKYQQCICLNDLADRVDEVYRQNYRRGEEYPIFEHGEENPSWETAGDFPEFIISEMLEVEEDVAKDLTSVLSELESYRVLHDGDDSYYDSTSTYEEIPIHEYEHSWIWREFCETVMHRYRFFNEKAIELLNNLFAGIADLNYVGDKAPIREISADGDERFVYRARRAANSNDRIKGSSKN